MKARKLEGIVTLCILIPLVLSALRITASAGVVGEAPEFPANPEVVVTAGLLLTYLILRRKLKSK